MIASFLVYREPPECTSIQIKKVSDMELDQNHHSHVKKSGYYI